MKKMHAENSFTNFEAMDHNPLQELLHAITDAIIMVDSDRQITFFNKGAEHILGYSKEVVIGWSVDMLFPQPGIPKFLLKVYHALEYKTPINFIENCPKHSVLLDVSIYPSESGIVIFIKKAGLSQQAEKIVQQKIAHQDILINGTTDFIWSLNDQLQLISFNYSFKNLAEKYLGRSVNSGEFFFDIISGTKIFDKWSRYFKKVLKGQTIKFDQAGLGFGLAGFLEVTLQPVQDVFNGEITGVACYAYDISKRKSNESLISQQNNQLREKEQNLRQLSTELQTILNASLDIICTINAEGNFVRVSNACINSLGFEPAEMVGKSFIDFMVKADHSAALNVLKKIKGGAEVTDFNTSLIKKNGTTVPFIWSARWDFEEDLMFAIGRDGSALYKAELMKLESEQRFTALIQKGADMIAIIDPMGNYKYVSSNVERILGYSDCELVGRNAFEYIHEEDRAFIAGELEKVMHTKEIRVGDFRFKNGFGEWRWVEVIGTNMLDNEIINGIVINSRDITERKQYEDELRNSNERFEIVSKATNEAIWDFNIVTGEMKWNENYTKLLGYSNLLEADLNVWKGRIHPDDVNRVWKEVEATLNEPSNIFWKSEYRYLKSDGEYAYVYDQGYIIMDKENKPIRFVGAMQDFTERKKIEEEREVIIKELVKSNNDLKQFSFITSHNLRAPLSNILGILQLIDFKEIDPENDQLLKLINTSALQLQETIKDLSDIIVIRNQGDVKNELLHIDVIFENVRKIYLNTLNDIAHTVEVDFKVNLVMLHKPYIESIFINLVSNAVKYRSPIRSLQIKISTSINEKGELQLIFEDNGIGLNTNRLKDRLFGLYQRFHDHTEGKGLGLFIVKSQVSALGGTIAIESEENKGTIFTITLPPMHIV